MAEVIITTDYTTLSLDTIANAHVILEYDTHLFYYVCKDKYTGHVGTMLRTELPKLLKGISPYDQY